MPNIKNVSPIGDLDVPLLRAIVKAGEIVTVSEAHARKLLAQADNWTPTNPEAKAILAELEAEAEALAVVHDEIVEFVDPPAEAETVPPVEGVDEPRAVTRNRKAN